MLAVVGPGPRGSETGGQPRPATGTLGLGPQVGVGGRARQAWRSRTCPCPPAHAHGSEAHRGGRRTEVTYENQRLLAQKIKTEKG
jgi:hypothetical protein